MAIAMKHEDSNLASGLHSLMIFQGNSIFEGVYSGAGDLPEN